MDGNKTKEWDKFYLIQAICYSSKSKDPSTKTGCVIVSEDNTPVGWGYNGLSDKMNRDLEDKIMNDRENKYERVIHAEENALLSSSQSLKNATAYITHPPCLKCCHRLSRKGVQRVVSVIPSEQFSSRWNKESTLIEMKSLGVEYQLYKKDQLNEDLDNVIKQFNELGD